MANCLASFLLLGSIDFPSKENGCCTYDKVGAAYMEHSENKINIYSVPCIISYTFSVKLQLLTANCSPGWTDTLWSKASTTCALQISCSGPSSCTQVGEVMSDSVARTGILKYWNTGVSPVNSHPTTIRPAHSSSRPGQQSPAVSARLRSCYHLWMGVELTVPMKKPQGVHPEDGFPY